MAAALNRFISRASDKCRPFFQLLHKGSKFHWTPDCDQALQQLKHYLSSPPLLSTPTHGEALYLYLALSDHAVSSVLIREEDSQQRPIYYTSKILLDAETRYLQLNKLSLALVSASRKLSHYFQTFIIVVVTKHPLKALFRKADFSGRISKWAVKLGQYDIKYQPRTAIKAQVLADFIVEFTSQSSAPTLLDTELGGNKDTEAATETEQEQSWKVFVDGSSTSNRAGASIVLQSLKGLVIEQVLTFCFKASNNEAEYEALIAGLNSAKILEARHIVIFSDSQLVTNQLSGDYQARDDRMAAYLAHTKELLSQFEMTEIRQVGRESNSHANALASLASAVEASNRRTVEVETLREPSIKLQRPRQLMCVDLGPSWMDPVIAYLKDDLLLEDKTEAQKIRLKAARFWLSPDGRLYRKSFTGPYLQCVHPSKVDDFLYEIHEGICGSHIGDIVGPLHRTPGNKRWLIVATDYFTKWIEGEPLSSITEQDTKNFVWKNIITRFGILRTLISDNGTQFDSNFFKSFCQEYGIRNVYSTPAYPQSNGEAEILNKVILDGLKKRLDRAKGRWTEELSSVLWAYMTTPRCSTWATPFSLACDMEVVIPLKQLARGYNQKVRAKRFAEGELVLKKTLPGDRNPNEGKLAPNWQGPYKVLSTAGRAAYRLEDMEGKELPRPWNTMHLKKFYF
ncbi:hypothetical protein AAC387_Pa12g2289 [Persea americana]